MHNGKKHWVWLDLTLILIAVAVTVPAIYARLTGLHFPTPILGAVLFGVAILGGAIILSWASEVAHMDLPPSLAIAILAVVAVLPEYAVDLYFAWQAAKDPIYTAYAAANMTGSNRLLIGLAWPLILLLFFLKTRKGTFNLLPANTVELSILGLATLYSFAIYFKASISLVDTIPLIGLFVVYIWIIAHAPVEEPELGGPPATIARLPKVGRRIVTVLLFLVAAGVIFASAEPFAENLLAMGHVLKVDEFLLVQWLAPLASEAPEIVVACILTLRGQANAAMTVMISAKVNQWTLLVGTIPVVYSISNGSPAALALDFRQQEEFLLTSAQSLFAVFLLASLRLRAWEALLLFLLFATQLVTPDPRVRLAFAALYVALCLVMVLVFRWRLRHL
ncbi:MAG: sodium:calcium antiporter, partial [Chloroflexota bacterium]